MLVVITIIGLMIGAIVLATGVVGRDYLLEDEANRFAARLGIARERAEIEARPYGAIVRRDEYRFATFDFDRMTWIDSDDTELKRHALPAGVELKLLLEGREVVLGTKSEVPQIGVGSDGEFAGFEVRLARSGDPATEVIAPDVEGGLRRTSASVTVNGRTNP